MRKCNKKHDIKYRSGKKALATHEAQEALNLLRQAVDACPAQATKELSVRLYWLSIALHRLGQDGLAIKALASAQKLAPRSRARQMYQRLTNMYGMQKSSCIEHDDYRAFCSIQLRQYLGQKKDRQFDSMQEAETVLEIITKSWLGISDKADESILSELDCNEKLKLFKSVHIEYPAFKGLIPVETKQIAVNFKTGKRAEEGRCPCGSGLPFQRCCGRLKPLYEKEHQ